MTKTLALLLALLALPALANPYADKAQTRVLHGWVEPDGTRIAALEITLAEGWHTYWRAPGDAGIPPSFNWQGSRNLASATPAWPRPTVYSQNGMRSIIYTGRLVLPISLTPKTSDKPIRVKGTVDIGVCKDICVPFQIVVDETIKADSTAATQAIKTALATVPRTGAQHVSCNTTL